MRKTRLCELLSIEYPIIQAPMVWITWGELAAAVSNAGGLGVIGLNAGERMVTTDVGETGERLRREIRKVKSLTNRPFGVNIIINPPSFPQRAQEYSDQTVKVALEEGIPVAVLVGHAPETYTRQFKDAGVKVLHRALPVNIEAARKAEQAGVDALVVVGFEGGGHVSVDRIPTFVLVPQIVDTVKIPVVAGGGIADGRGLAAALALGAEGIYMGTRFIASTECPAHPEVKQAILDATDTSTATCTGLLGVARALKNPLMERCMEMEAKGATLRDVTRAYSSDGFIALLQGDMTNGCIACGIAAGMIKEIKGAGDIVRDIVREAEQVIAGLK